MIFLNDGIRGTSARYKSNSLNCLVVMQLKLYKK